MTSHTVLAGIIGSQNICWSAFKISKIKIWRLIKIVVVIKCGWYCGYYIMPHELS